MKSLKFYLDTRRVKAEDELCPVRINYTKNRKVASITTDIRIAPSQWDAKLDMVIGHPRAKTLNTYLSTTYATIENMLIVNGDEFRPLSATEVVARLRTLLNPEVEVKAKNLFWPRAEKFMNDKTKPRTKAIYAATLSRIKAYCNNYDKLLFTDITVDWLRDFDKFLLKDAPSRNARNIHFRNIRAIFNDAIDDEVITFYPFRKFKIRNEATVKRSLTVEQLARLFVYEPNNYTIRYLDMFRLMFYLIGINTVDLAGLQKIIAGRVEYHRAKTNRLYSIKVEPEAEAIIEKYKRGKHLINFFDGYQSYLSFGRLMNKGLHDLGKAMDAEYSTNIYSGITTYWARHTWATIAAELDIPKETIAKALGHGGNEVTDVYIRFDDKKVDKANRKVIDYLNEHIEKLKAGN